LTNPFLLIIALFVWVGAGQEASKVRAKSVLENIPVNRATLTNFETLAPSDPISKEAWLILSESQQDFRVVADGSVVRILTRDDLVQALSEYNDNMYVSYVMDKDFQTDNLLNG